MHLRKTKIPGVKQLHSVGYADSYYYCGYGKPKTMQQRYNAVMKKKDLNCSLVVASLTVSQRAGIKCLKANGFKQIGTSSRNPNSGNSILLLAKSIKKR